MFTTKNIVKALCHRSYPLLAGIALCVVGCGAPGSETEGQVDTEAIIGGTATSTTAWPWAVRIYLGSQEKCGGSLIAPGWVLTVAHCLADNPNGVYFVQLGTDQMIQATKVYPHPSFVNDGAVTGHYDIGLIQLSSLALPGPNIGYIRPAVGDDGPGTQAVAIGRGMTNHDYRHPTISGLQQVSLPVVPNASCSSVWAPRNGVVYPDELCAGFNSASPGICFGDSGSALMVQRASGTWEEIGSPSVATLRNVTDAFGNVVATVACESYAIYARTSALVGWVRGYVPDAAWFPGFNAAVL